MNTPRTRADFERNFHLLRRRLQDGKFKVMQPASGVLDALGRVRFLPNGRLDFLSVDERARNVANTMNHIGGEILQEQLKGNQDSTDVSPEVKD